MQAPRRVCAALEKESSQSAVESNKNFVRWWSMVPASVWAGSAAHQTPGLMRLISPIRRDLLSLY
jgi:hypothetical protein